MRVNHGADPDFPMPVKLGRSEKCNKYRWFYWYRCGLCETEFIADPTHIGRSTFSCGCLRIGKRYHFVDWTGKQVNYLQVIKEAFVSEKDQCVHWECICTYRNCGRTCYMSSVALHRGRLSCGCYIKHITRERHLKKYKEKNQ